MLGRTCNHAPPPKMPQYSNHTGYPTIKGKAFDGDHLRELLQVAAPPLLVCGLRCFTPSAWAGVRCCAMAASCGVSSEACTAALHLDFAPHCTPPRQGLQANGLVRHTHLLTGYIGTQSLLEAIAQVAQALRAVNPDLTYGGWAPLPWTLFVRWAGGASADAAARAAPWMAPPWAR